MLLKAKGKKVSAAHLWCVFYRLLYLTWQTAPLKTGGKKRDHRTPRVSLVQKHEYFTYLHPYSPPLPPPPISSPLILRLSAFAFHMPGWLGDAAPCNSSQAPAREAVAMAIWHRGIFFPSAFFPPFPPLLMMLLLLAWAQFTSQCSITTIIPIPHWRGLYVCVLLLCVECL